MQISDQLSWIDSIILGIVQGITEFLPVSSDGHLVVFRHLLDYHREVLVFDVLLHFGTLGSLFLVFRKDLIEWLQESLVIFKDLLRTKKLSVIFSSKPEKRAVLYVWLTTFVTGVMGLVFEDIVAETFTSLLATSVGFFITSAFLFVGHRSGGGQKSVGILGWWFPVALGLAQSLALLPGVSRSGSTICLALACGVHRNAAGKYSFLAAIPIIFMASIYQSRHLFDGSEHENLLIVLAGVVTAFVTGVFALRLLLWMLNRQKLLGFAIYTLILAVLSLGYVYGR